ncbi:MAG: imidazoleglycerol-phosphate dehydratase [Omnitrophica bacterium RIFCSPHIGHO2_12_FULL_44_12]|nr:MAG: imidazoleglycerol-phosphate dehydratase [Omnitrophica bacterium RIFCSPHIGHO2_12_FULL_44_12]
MPKRRSKILRETKETKIKIVLNIDGCGKSKISTGIPFLDHMLTSLAKHGLLDLQVKAKGDLAVYIHHTNEDIGISLGKAFAKALDKKTGIQRFGFSSVPMDDTLVRITLDFSGRPAFNVIQNKGVKFTRMETYSFHDATEFLRAFSQNSEINLFVEIVSGQDTHHIIEATFKALAKALEMATRRNPRIKGVPSTKGTL